MGFEPTPPKRLVPETSALDRSAIQPKLIAYLEYLKKMCTDQLDKRKRKNMRRPGIKPGSRPWQGRILSLYYRRTLIQSKQGDLPAAPAVPAPRHKLKPRTVPPPL